MDGFYLYATLDGITVLRWYRTAPEVLNEWERWSREGIEGTIRGAA